MTPTHKQLVIASIMGMIDNYAARLHVYTCDGVPESWSSEYELAEIRTHLKGFINQLEKDMEQLTDAVALSVWKDARDKAAKEAERLVLNPPPRKTAETFTAWILRVQRVQAEAIEKWQELSRRYNQLVAQTEGPSNANTKTS